MYSQPPRKIFCPAQWRTGAPVSFKKSKQAYKGCKEYELLFAAFALQLCAFA
jgi:hypothetical protein